MSTPQEYYPVVCPGCKRQAVIRLELDETPDTPCTCKRVACAVVWTSQVQTHNGQTATVYGPELIAKIAQIVTDEAQP
jgi:hypothetical protein